MNTDRKKYLMVLLITTGIFIVVFGLVNYLNNQKIANVDDLQRKITADLIATETQFDLLKTAPCASAKNTILSQELGELGEKLDFAQNNQGIDNPDVLQLKKYYSLLQVKDYLLMQELSSKCDIDIDSILYFYSTDCSDCVKQGYVLTELKKRYPDLRIYSFDTDLDFSVIETFSSLYDFGDTYPALIIDDETIQGFISLQDLEDLFPGLIEQKEEMERQVDVVEFISSSLDISSEEIILSKLSDTEYPFVTNTTLPGSVYIDENGDMSIGLEE